MGRFRVSGNVIIGGKRIPTDAPIVTWDESGWNAALPYCIPTLTEPRPQGVPLADGMGPYGKHAPRTTRRYSLRRSLRSFGTHVDRISPGLIKSAIRQFVVHHDGCASADMCFNVLQNERGLSCHFLIDNDGTIYQTVDLALAAWHAERWNEASIGVELCNRGDVRLDPTYYLGTKHGPTRDQEVCEINGHRILAWGYPPKQLDGFARLARALQKLLPNLPLEFPQTSPGVQAQVTLPEPTTLGFAGYIGHYHLIREKWDPGPFDFKKFIKSLRGAFTLPIYVKEPTSPDDVPVVAEQLEDLKVQTDALYKANESGVDGGFFPVGPWGEHRLWHGGVHVAAKQGWPVFAPFPGRILAARMGASSSIGSNNFVLMRHVLAFGESKIEFYSLYMHLADELTAAKPVGWLAKPDGGWAKAGKPGEVVLLDEPIEGGAPIGHVGTAGPGNLAKPQIHVSLFSTSELFTDQASTPWEVIDGTSGGRFCDVSRVLELLDTNRDGRLAREELSDLYASGGGAQSRNLVVLHVSEWTVEPSWTESLKIAADFKHLGPAQIDELVADQVLPGLWWTDEVAEHCRLPKSGEVYHYHPVAFLQFVNQEIAAAAAANPEGPKLTAADTKEIPPSITDDFGDKDGSSMRSNEAAEVDPCDTSLDLQDMVLGFEAPGCGPQ